MPECMNEKCNLILSVVSTKYVRSCLPNLMSESVAYVLYYAELPVSSKI